MTVADGKLSTTFRVGRRYRCSISIPLSATNGGVLALETVWHPDVPVMLTTAELAEYRRGRDVLLAEAARLSGARVAVIEV